MRFAMSLGALSPGMTMLISRLLKKIELKLNSPALKEMLSNLGYDIYSDENGKQALVGYKIYKKDKLQLGDKEARIFLDLFLYEQEGEKYVLTRPNGRTLFKDTYFTVEEVESKKDYQFGPLTVKGLLNPAPSSVRE